MKYPLSKIKSNDKKKNNLNNIKNNKIILTVKIDNPYYTYRDVYFLDNTDYKDEDTNIEHYHNNLKELNEFNTELYIDDVKCKYQKYFKPKKEGTYTIKLNFNADIKDLSFMFFDCENIINIDLSSFNPENITNMNNMFRFCESLESLPDISNWDTKNVTNMFSMFGGCKSLKSLPDISNWNTKNVTNICEMFCDCESLISLPNISKWDIKNVKNMSGLFNGCKLLEILPDISNWNTKNVTNMS